MQADFEKIYRQIKESIVYTKTDKFKILMKINKILIGEISNEIIGNILNLKPIAHTMLYLKSKSRFKEHHLSVCERWLVF